MVMHACVALKRCAASGSIPTNVAPPLVHALEEVMLRTPKDTQAEAWFGAAEQVTGSSIPNQTYSGAFSPSVALRLCLRGPLSRPRA